MAGPTKEKVLFLKLKKNSEKKNDHLARGGGGKSLSGRTTKKKLFGGFPKLQMVSA